MRYGKHKANNGPREEFPNPAKESFARILAVKISLLLFVAAVVARLVHVQVIESPDYQSIAKRQYEARVVLPATRGNIVDRNGKLLVSNTTSVSFGADPRIVGANSSAIAERFARVFDKPRAYYLDKLTNTDKRFVWLERRVSSEYGKKISATEFEGLIQMNEPQRIYHYDHIGGQLIGFTNIDNKGISGIELQFDRQLKGTDGYAILLRDGLGRRRPSVDHPRVEPQNGNNVVLTIDLEYQAIAEEELKKGVERNKAEGGLVVMLDPSTGEVLAMANYPTLNPAAAGQSEESLKRNRIITDMFEPGSVFKIVTASAALEYSLVGPEQKFFAEHGSYTINLPRGKTRTITDTHEYGTLTFREAMELSSNIIMAKVSDIIGSERLYTTARNYGFGTPTGIELPGEVGGELKKPNQWSGTTLNSIAYGYEVGVTPIQIAAAYGVVASNGMLMRPYVLKQILNDQGDVVEGTRPQSLRKVVSPPTVKILREFFEGVVASGTGVPARLEMVTAAGKTGTSRKYVAGKYEPGSYTASFAGFFPAENPKVVCLVMIDNPRAGGYTGGLASAPIFKRIAEKVLAISDRFTSPGPVAADGKRKVAVPDVSSLKVEAAKELLSASGLEVECYGKSAVVGRQVPLPGTKVDRGTTVKLINDDIGPALANGLTNIPDVRGLTIRRAINRLTMQQLGVDVDGSGVVVSQFPAAGTQVRIGSKVTIRCAPKGAALVSLY
jgi:cell division protein FtsI (penicillin-binding protein 3)